MKQHNINIISVVGARPNFMKVTPLHKAFQQHPYVNSKVVHAGQHYDEKMSKIFFDELKNSISKEVLNLTISNV